MKTVNPIDYRHPEDVAAYENLQQISGMVRQSMLDDEELLKAFRETNIFSSSRYVMPEHWTLLRKSLR